MKTKKYKLSARVDYNFTLIGIVSADKIYKLAWYFNTYLGFEFMKSEDLIIAVDNQDITKMFEVFASASESTLNTFNIISNKCENGFLLNQFKNIDFILKIQPSISESETIKLIDNIRSIASVISVFSIDNNLIKDKEKQYFIF